MAALKDTKLPKLNGEVVDYKTMTKEKLPLKEKNAPVSVTIYKIGKELFVDPTNEEENLADARLTVATLEDGRICAMQKGGEATLTIDEIDKMVDISLKHAKALRKEL